VGKAQAFMESARASATTANSVEQEALGALTVLSSSVTRAPGAPGAGAVSTVLRVAANPRTGTLYTVRFDIPSDELDRVSPLGTELLQNMRLDDTL
jgi:hypothetical protein